MRKISMLPVLFFVLQVQLSAQQRKFDRPMELIKCSIDIKADLFTATTFIEMEFYNDNNQEIEGLYTFQLKPEQVITAFQLDLNGKYRDGSIEEKWKARNAYNTIVGKRVDPALLMMNGYGQYSLNIYPVPGKGSRKITMTILQLLKTEQDKLIYELPLNIQNIVKDFQLSIKAGNRENKVSTRPGLIADKTFSLLQDQYSMDWNAENVYLNRSISFSTDLFSKAVACTQSIGNENFFALRFQPACEADFDIHPEKITVFWDASASAKNRNITKEINFLKQFISFHKVKQLTIIPFNHAIIDTIIFYTGDGFNSRWDQYLKDIKYDGATQLGKIDLTSHQADIFFLFSDGNNSYGRSKPITGTSPIYCVHSSFAANETTLQKIVGTNGGRVINLETTSLSNAISINNKGTNWLMSISSKKGKTIIDQSLPVPISKNIFINGTMFAGDDTLIIQYGQNNKVIKTQTIYLPANKECPGDGVARIPALIRFKELLYSYNWEEVLEFGLKEKFVTLNTAYIVLEKVEDYIKYNITPPKELEDECEALQYVKKDTRQQRQQLKLADEFEVLERTVASYNEKILRSYGEASFIKLTKADFVNAQSGNIGISNPESPKTDATKMPIQGDVTIGSGNGSNLSEVVVVSALGVKRSDRVSAYSSQVISGEELSMIPQTNIVDALAGKVAGVQVRSQSDGLLNKTGSVRIRGGFSLADVEPMYIIDGTPVTAFDVNPSDVESVTVLKGANATALFGSDAANGAIVINTKKKNRNWFNYYNDRLYRLKDMEDVDYLKNIKDVMGSEKLEVYMQLKEIHGQDPGFYFDIAQHFFEMGLTAEAENILMNAAEESAGDLHALRAVAFVFENWKMFDKAIVIYESLLETHPEYFGLRRDLALAYYQNSDLQKAVDLFYEAIKESAYLHEYWKFSIKATMLNELNAIIASHKDSLDVSAIPASLIKPLAADLRIVLDGNGGSFNNFYIKEPTGDICSFGKPVTKTGAMLGANNYSYYYSAPVEYQVRNAKDGKYKICVNYYHYGGYFQTGRAPSFIRIITFRNFGKPGQAMQVENVIMDNQSGEVEISSAKW